jgi:hypothetical protein
MLEEQLDGYDLYASHDSHGTHLFEVKTWTAANLAKQIRSGWAQLFEYRYRNASHFGTHPPHLYLVLDREPPFDYWAWTWLAEKLDVLPCWILNKQLVTLPVYSERLPPT